MRKIRRLVNGLMQRTCTASCGARVRPHARRWTALCIIYVDGLMHFSCTASCTLTWRPLCKLYPQYMYMDAFVLHAIFIIHNINSEISYLVIAHTKFRIKFAIKIELDAVF